MQKRIFSGDFEKKSESVLELYEGRYQKSEKRKRM